MNPVQAKMSKARGSRSPGDWLKKRTKEYDKDSVPGAVCMEKAGAIVKL